MALRHRYVRDKLRAASHRPFRVPPIGPVLFLTGLVLVFGWRRSNPAPLRPDPLSQAVISFFQSANLAKGQHASLLRALYMAPPERLRIIEYVPVSTQTSPETASATTTISVTAADIATQAAVKRDTRLYWTLSGGRWILDADRSTIDALTVNLLRTVRDNDASIASLFLPPAQRSHQNGSKLVERYNWLPEQSSFNKLFDEVSVMLSPDSTHAASSATWRLYGSEETGRIELSWVKQDGEWWIELP